MQDLAWTRKYRPASFDDYIGDNVKNLVINRLKDRNSIPNTIMLYGTRGTGKTSMARLMCKEILCESPVDGHSCGHCDMCKEVEDYISSTEAGVECFGITEINAAETTGKDDINDIVEEAIIPPVGIDHKIIILDECHKLSKAAQNSILKVLEEPPRHLIFILCTTDPDDVIGTIHSRMQLKIEVRKKSVDELANKLLEISQKENLKVSMEALKIVAKKGDRVPRECINILENIAKNCGNSVTVEDIRRCIGDVATDIYVDFIRAANTSLEDILLFNKRIKENDVGAKQFISGLTRFCLDAMYVKHGIALEDYSSEFVAQAKQLFTTYHSSEFDTLLQVLENASSNIDNDDTKNELLITNTALRIGKIGLLAQGLGNEAKKAEEENKESLIEYRKRVVEDEAKQFEKIKEFSPTKEVLGGVFKQMTDITGPIDTINKAIPLQVEEEKTKKTDSTTIDKDELEKLLGL